MTPPPSDPARLILIGGGKMGEALLVGMGKGGLTVVVVEVDPDRRTELATRYGSGEGTGEGLTVVETIPEATPRRQDGAVIAVKPGDVQAACRALAETGVGRVLSIAAGLTLTSLEGWLPGIPVLRAMPNTPALVGAGASALASGSTAEPDDTAWGRQILESVGTVVELPEKSLDAVTGLSGSGPAYVFLLAEAMIDAGVLVGLARPVARQLAVQTLLGAARMLDETGDEPATLRADVTSPGGTTAAGLRALESAGFRTAVLDAVSAAAEKAHQMGRP